MKKCRCYIGPIVMAFFTIICFSPGCEESYPISGSGDEVPELANPNRAVYMAPANAIACVIRKSEQKKSKDKKAEPDGVFYEDLLGNGRFAILLIYHLGIHERCIRLVFGATLSIPEIIHGVYTDEGSCDNGLPNAAKRKYYKSMIPGTSRATIPILNDGSMDRVYIDVEGDELYDYVLNLSPSES